MIVAPNSIVVKRGVIIGSTINLGHGLGGFLAGRNLSRSLKLREVNTRVVGTP
jgi:hypothetical protein